MSIKHLLAAALTVATFGICAAPSNPSPANYATVDTHTSTMNTWLAKSYTDKFFRYTTTGSASRIALGDDYKVNGIVRLSWSGTTGSCTVKVVRMSDGYTQNFTTSAGYVDLLAPEIGRNYKWTVTNGGSSSTWYFYTSGTAPRIIPQQLSIVGNCRDIGGWVTADGRYRVRQGLGFRNDHNADFYEYSALKPFWTDIVHVRTDMDLRDKLGSSNYYYIWEMDGNDSHGRSPYGENWWTVQYWNILREGTYGGQMQAYKSLVEGISGASKRGSQNTWKQFADADRLPIVVHCSQGRDRTGTVCFMLLGALGVPLNDLYTDWALTDYAAAKDFPQTSADEGGSLIVPFYNALKTKYPDSTYPTLQDKCVALMKAIGVTDAEIANLKSYFLEPVEPKLSAAPSKTSITVPTLSRTRVTKTGSVQKPTVTANAQYTVDYGGGDYKNYGKYLVTVTLKDPEHYQWSDGTYGPKVLPFVIEHTGNIFQGNVRSFIKGDTSPKIMIARPRYQGEVTCSYTEEQLNNLAPGTYTATFTAKSCELSSQANTHNCRFTVYPATERPAYTYEYADLNEAYFKTDYVPALQTDKVEVRMMDQADGLGGGYFSCADYPSQLSIFKLSAGVFVYYQGSQNVHVEGTAFSWTANRVYRLTAYGKTGTIVDEAANKTISKTLTLDKVIPTPGPAFIGTSLTLSANRGAEGTPQYHAPHRLYHVKIWKNGSTLAHEFVPCRTTGGNSMLYDKSTGKLYPFSHVLDKTGTVTLGGTSVKVPGSDEPDPPPSEPVPEPTVTSTFDANHTIICYGDSLTWGAEAPTVTMDSRANYHDGRLAGVAEVPKSYPWWLSEMVPNYNVINQSRSGSQTCNITSWSGEQQVKVKNAFTLPATGSVSLNKNFVFKDCAWGEWGGWAATESGDQDVQNRWGGFVTPIFPLYEAYNEGTTRYSVTGTLGGRHVRLAGLHPTNITVTVFGSGSAQNIAANTVFIPDTTTNSRFTNAIRIICAGANDGGQARYQTHIKPLLQAFANKGGKYIITTSWEHTYGSGESVTQLTPTAMEADMASTFGSHFLNLRLALATNGLATAVQLGALTQSQVNALSGWSVKNGQGLFCNNSVHFTAAGNKVFAEFVRRKLVALGYVTSGDPSVDPEHYGDPDSAARTYTWKGYTGPWSYTTNWTASAGATYGIPNHATRATADFPSSLANAFTATIGGNTAVDKVYFDSPNMTLVLDNAALTVNGAVGTSYGCFNFGNSQSGNSTIVFRGANPGIVDNKNDYVAGFGALNSGATGICTVRFEVPAANWSQAPVRCSQPESKVWVRYNTKFEVDATALGVPGSGETVTVPLASSPKMVQFIDDCFSTVIARSVVTCAPGAQGVIELDGNSKNLVLSLTASGIVPSEPVPEPVVSSAFDSDHTILCYGDSLTWGLIATNVTVDARPNFFDGRLAGLDDVPASYPYMLSGYLPQTYNVINVSRSGSPAHQMTAWSGDSVVKVDRPFVLPAVGSVTIATNLVFSNDCPWGKWGRWAGTGSTPAEREDTFNRWAGFVTPIYSPIEPYDPDVTRFSITGTLAGRHVRIQGIYPTNITVTVFGTGVAQTVPAGSEFVPDMATMPHFTNAIRIVCGAGNDSYTTVAEYQTRVKPYFQEFASHGGKYIVISQECQTHVAGESQLQSTPTAMENDFAATFGEHHLNLRMAFVTNGMATAKLLGVVPANSTETWDQVLMHTDKTHLTSAGYAVMAEFVRRKLVALGYVTGGEPAVDPEDYGAADKAARTYTWKGNTAPWRYTTSWTPSSGATYGIPNSASYATADFPSSLAGEFTATVDSNASVKYAHFNSPKMTLRIDNATLTVNDAVVEDTYNASVFTPSADADSVLEFTGANPGLVLQRGVTRQYFGYRADSSSATGEVAIKFTVPAANWANAPIRVAGGDSKFFIGYNVKFVIDATALGVPTEGNPVTVPLVSTTDGICASNGNPAACVAAATVICANGASGVASISGNSIVFTLSKSDAPAAFAIVAPADNATDVSVVRPGHTAFFAMDRDARWAAVDNSTYRNTMVETSSFPQEVEFSWQGGTAPYTFTLKRVRDNRVVKSIPGISGMSVSVGNLEIGRAYTWEVTDSASATVSGSFTTAYADQRFLKVGASNAASVVAGYSSVKSSQIHANAIPNFRDFGGMFIADGSRRVKQNVVFRSFGFDRPGSSGYESLGADLDVITNEFGIKTDLDLRSQNETANVRAHGASPLGANVNWINKQILAYDVDSLGAADDEALRLFLDPSNFPLVFHCSAGQDRTGTLAMLLGAILDLDEEDIEKGWSASCFFQNAMDVPGDDGFQTHRIKRFFGSYAKYGVPGDTFAECVRKAIKAKTTLTDADFATIRANLLETDSEVVRPVKATVDIPDPNAIGREYDGSAQTTYLRSNARYTVSMSDFAVLPGNYAVTLSLVDPSVCTWSDSSTQDKIVQFSITGEGPVVVTPAPEYTVETDTLTFLLDTVYTYTGSITYEPTSAVFEPGAAIVVEPGTEVEVHNVCLEGAENGYTAEGRGSSITLYPKQAELTPANTAIAFNAYDGGVVKVRPATDDRWKFTDSALTVSVEGINDAFIALDGSDLNGSMIRASVTDSTLKFNSFNCSRSGSVVALTNSALKTNWNGEFGNGTTLILAGAKPQIRSANGAVNYASGSTIVIAPELSWSAEEGRILCPAPSGKTSAMVTVASGVNFVVDVSAFSGITTNFTFRLLSADTTSATRNINLPSAANVTVTGVDADHCEVTFSKGSDNRYIDVTVSSVSAVPQPVIGGTGGATFEMTGDSLNLRISNLVQGRTYGYKYAEDLLTPDEEWVSVWLDAGDLEIDTNGEAIMAIPLFDASACFFRIIAK